MEVVGAFPSSAGADVDAAVAAAAEAFPAWAGGGPAKRAAVLTGAAEAVERRAEQIAQDMTLEMGKPIREARMEVARAAQIMRFFAGETFRPRGEVYEQAATGSTLYTRAAAARRRRADHAVELPGRDPGLEARAALWPTATPSC